MNKTIYVQPLEAMMNLHRRTIASRGPHAANDGFQANSVFIHRPQLENLLVLARQDKRARVLVQVFLNSAWSAGEALAWRGRGTLRLKLKRWRTSHPRACGTLRPKTWLIHAATCTLFQGLPSVSAFISSPLSASS